MQPDEGHGGDWSRLYHEAPCGYLSLLDDGTVTQVNDTLLAWTGRRRDDVLGGRLHDLLPVGDQILYDTHCRPQLLLAGVVEEAVIDVLAADGTRRPALMTARRQPPTAERPAVVRAVLFGAAQRRRYERDLLSALRRAETAEAELRTAEDALRRLVLHDPLTGLPNRAGLTSLLQAELGASAVHGGHLVVLFLDLDHFKAVNDSLGHAAGDELLVLLAGRLEGAVRASATVARLSGDEFVVIDRLSPELDAAGGQLAAEDLARRLLGVLAVPAVVDGLEIIAGASAGVAVVRGRDTDAESALRRADIAMYRAKARGRGGFEVHDPDHADPEVERLRRLGELRQAISGGELRLRYQPRVGLADGLLHGVEALVRWEHPVRGLLLPGEFIELAEQSGLIRQLGAWVLDRAVEHAVAWYAAQEGPHRRIEVAVNVAAAQLADPALVGEVEATLARHGLEASMLTLEITETALLHDVNDARVTLERLKRLGVRTSVDDFGTGYTNFAYLKQFPVAEMKIDRSFVRGISEDAADRAIVASCIQLAGAIGAQTVAEGVETEEQLAVLVELGCDFAQGFLLGRPMEADDLLGWDHDRRRLLPTPRAGGRRAQDSV